MNITSISVYRFSIPMELFVISSGTMDYAQNVLIHINTDSNLIGVGECSAFPAITGETQDSCFAMAQQFAQLWKGKDAENIDERLDELDAFVEGNNTIKSAFDIALYDLVAKAVNQPLYKFLGGIYSEPESDLTIGIGTVEKMAATALDFVNNRGVKIIKVKLGKNAEEDKKRIAAIREAVGPQIALRIDANQGWRYEDAESALREMEPFNIQFCEQPLSKKQDERMPELRRQTNIRLMADESVFTSEDAERVVTEGGFDYVNIKLCKAGGIRQAKKIHDICTAHNITNMLGGMLESRVALSANVHFALASPNVQFYDMDTCLLGHKLDPVINGVQFDEMVLKLPDLPGIGADADPVFLQTCEKVTV